MVRRTLEMYEGESGTFGEVLVDESTGIYYAEACASYLKVVLEGEYSDIESARKAIVEKIGTPYTMHKPTGMSREAKLEFIVRSFIENLDVNPYEMSIEEAKEVIENVRPDVETTPEELASVWNAILPEYMEEE